MPRNSETELLTARRARELLSLDRRTGYLTWKHPARPKLVGKRAGSLHSNGYRVLTIDRRSYPEHRVVWLFVHGEMPVEIDHRNGNKSDNRPRNLRDGTHAQNMQNRRKAVAGKSWPIGVRQQGGGFIARIRTNGVLTYLGTFATSKLASDAYLRAKREAHVFCTI